MRLKPSQSSSLDHALAPFAPAVIYVFGSYGTPAWHPGSDIDIAFLPMNRVDSHQLFRIANRLSGEFGTEVDLIDLSRASTVFRKEVIRTGEPVRVYDEPAMRQFEMLALSDYARLNEERRETLAAG
ncbi:MAG: type VII toxin-antitoxin system MntA family adenylyltransferase antitoxin [Verrucomicrobiales bacterium]